MNLISALCGVIVRLGFAKTCPTLPALAVPAQQVLCSCPYPGNFDPDPRQRHDRSCNVPPEGPVYAGQESLFYGSSFGQDSDSDCSSKASTVIMNM